MTGWVRYIFSRHHLNPNECRLSITMEQTVSARRWAVVLCQSEHEVVQFKAARRGGGVLSREQECALDSVRTTERAGVCLQGPYGTGKTAIVQELVSAKQRTKAGAEGGQEIDPHHCTAGYKVYTIWSYLKMKVGSDMGTNMSTLRPVDAMNIADVQWLVLMDYTMMPGCHLHILDSVLRKFRRSSDPFGGIKMMFVGDAAPCGLIDDDYITKHASFRALALDTIELEYTRALDEDDAQYQQLIMDVG